MRPSETQGTAAYKTDPRDHAPSGSGLRPDLPVADRSQVRGTSRTELPRQPTRGFALLLTLTLLSFLVLILVGLATYTRVESGVAVTMQRQTQARENALLGLNVALGQLQKYAGPDQRVTTTAEAFSYRTGSRWFTGVWDSNTTDKTPLTWLVSGNEVADASGSNNPLAVTPASTVSGTALVSTNTSPTSNDVVARLVPIRAPGVPGAPTTATATIGNYAWWVGDQGVKAPVALHDRALASSGSSTSTITYAPYDSVELRRRIRQQVPLGAGAATSAGAAVFEPRTSSGTDPNSTLSNNTVAFNQLSFLKNSSSAAIGLATAKSYFQYWSPDNKAVLVDTLRGGLKRDLSLRPDLLGSAFAAWANYPAYMEDIANPATPAAMPAIASAESLRRRYRMGPTVTEGEIAHRIAPVLTFCLLNFDSHTLASTSKKHDDPEPIAMNLRWVIGLWNPYSSALVPEDLRVEITGLPDVLEFAAEASSETLASISPSMLFGSPLRLALPWDYSRTDLQDTDTPKPDVSSWLPGRVYYWASVGNTEEQENGNVGYFYSKSLIRSGQSSVVQRVSEVPLLGTTPGGWRTTGSTQLVVRVFRKDDTEPIATYTSPTFEPFFATDPDVDPALAKNENYEFSFLFRLNATAAAAWLTENGRDPRGATLPDTAYMAGANGPLPSAYPGLPDITNNDLLLERTMGNTGRSYNEDVPVFELPRAPLLSLGSLQHLHLPAVRPFVVGNPWGDRQELISGTPANSIFDRYFLSGLAAPVLANADALLASPVNMPLPNPLLQVLPRKTNGTATLLGDVLGVSSSVNDMSEGYSSRLLLQRGAFNLNSTSGVAWVAVLRSSRYANGDSFRYLNASTSTGTTTSDTSVLTTTPANAVFHRFSQSAQETYEADDPATISVDGSDVLSTYAASTTSTGTAPNVASQANTHLFRRGMRALSQTETVNLANAIAALVRSKHADSGPFRSIQDFLAPRVLYAAADGRDRSLLEAAIEDTGLNANIAEFSSQWLTPADVMTALAPMLFPRSDTFVIRTYGEVINPATGGVEGRAWCEAQVQRLPEYFEPKAKADDTVGDLAETMPADLTSTLNQTFGRRFKVVAFRWLTRADI